MNLDADVQIFTDLNKIMYEFYNLDEKPNKDDILKDAFILLQDFFGSKNIVLPTKKYYLSARHLFIAIEQYLNLKIYVNELNSIMVLAKEFHVEFIKEICGLKTPIVEKLEEEPICSPNLSPDFIEEAAKYIPTAKFDLQEASNCLIYEIPTGAVFHFFRIINLGTLKYLKFVTNKKFGYLTQTECVSILEKQDNADKRIVGLLKYLNDYFANPTDKIEVTYSMKEAGIMFGLVNNVVAQILFQLEYKNLNEGGYHERERES